MQPLPCTYDLAAAGQGMFVHFGLHANMEVADCLAAQQAAASNLKLRRSKQQTGSKRIRRKLLGYKCTTCPHYTVTSILASQLTLSFYDNTFVHTSMSGCLLMSVALRLCQHLACCQPASLNCVRSNNCNLHVQAEKEEAEQSSAKQLEARSTEGAEDPKEGCRGTTNLSSSLACVGSKNGLILLSTDSLCCCSAKYCTYAYVVVVSNVARNVTLMSSVRYTTVGVLGTDICLTCRLTTWTGYKVPGVTARL